MPVRRGYAEFGGKWATDTGGLVYGEAGYKLTDNLALYGRAEYNFEEFGTTGGVRFEF